MIIGENNIIQTGYEPHLHRQYDPRSYLNPRFQVHQDGITRGTHDAIKEHYSSTTPEFQTMDSALLEARKLSREKIPFYLRLYLNLFLLRVNDFTINDSSDYVYVANRFNTSVREQIYQPLVYNRLNIRGVPRIFGPYEELQFFGINYGGESPRSYSIRQGLIENSANTDPKYLNEVKDFGIRINSMLFPTNERFKADKEIYKTSFEGNARLPTIEYSPEYFDLMKEINLSNSINRRYFTPKTDGDLLLDNTDEVVIVKDPVIYFSEFDPLKMTYNEFKTKVKNRATEYSNRMHEYSEGTAKQNGINYDKSITHFGEWRYSLSDYVPKNIYLKKNTAWNELHVSFCKLALYITMSDLYKVGFGTETEDKKILVSPDLFRKRLIRFKELLKDFYNKFSEFRSSLVSSSDRIPNPWFAYFRYSNPKQGENIGRGRKITNLDIGEYILNSLNFKMMTLVSLNPFTGIDGRFADPCIPLFYCGDELNDNQIKMYKVYTNKAFNFIAPEIFVYSGDSPKITSELPGSAYAEYNISLGDEEATYYLFTKKGYDLPISNVGPNSTLPTYETEKMNEEFSGRKGIMTWFMEEFNKLYSVNQHRYKTLLNAILEIVSKSAFNNLRYGVLSGETLKKYKKTIGIDQDDEVKILFLVAKTKDKNKRTHNIPLDDFYKLMTDTKYHVHGYKNKISNKNALMMVGSDWNGKITESSYLDDLRREIEALPDQVLKWEHIDLIVKYVFFSILHNVCAPDNRSKMPDIIGKNDDIDVATDKYMESNLLENVSTWHNDLEFIYKKKL
nr:MAG TPA: hypothetical protein [Caudoviricetes sp.]